MIKVVSTNTLLKTDFFSVKSDCLLLTKEDDQTKQLEKEYIYLECKNFIVAIVEKEESILIIDQYRHSIKKINTEFVAGAIEEGDTSEQTLVKELKEEAGIIPNKYILLGKCHPSVGLINNIGYVYLVSEFSETSSSLEEYEDFCGLKKSWIKINDYIENLKTQEIKDGISLMAWNLYLNHKVI